MKRPTGKVVLVTIVISLTAVAFAATPARAARRCHFDPSINRIKGTDGADVLRGTDDADVILAGAGNDVIEGLGGGDTICAGKGSDEVEGGEGTDHVKGGTGPDDIDLGPGGTLERSQTALGGYGSDVMEGGSGVDYMIAFNHSGDSPRDDGDEIIHGGDGPDVLEGSNGTNVVYGQGGDDRILQQAQFFATDEVDGGAGTDLVIYGCDREDSGGLTVDLSQQESSWGCGTASLVDIENVQGPGGGAGDSDVDTLIGDGGPNKLIACTWAPESNCGNTNITGGGGDDVLIGGEQIDTLRGGEGADDITAGAGNDFLFGEAGTDVLRGDGGTDTCDAEQGETATSCEVQG